MSEIFPAIEAVTAETLPELQCRIIAGGANNILAAPDEQAEALAARGILYAPDFLANAGGVIYLEEQLRGHDDTQATARVNQLGDLANEIFWRARDQKITTVRAATDQAAARLAARRTQATA